MMSDKEEEERPSPPCKKLKFKVKRTEAVTVSKSNIMSSSNEKPTCSHCSKTFLSVKSLHGHMRTHPDRPYRGMDPPKKSIIDSDADDQVVVNASSDSDDQELPSSSVDNDEAEDELMMGAAFALMLLATGDEFYRTLPGGSEKDGVRVPPINKKGSLDDNGGCRSSQAEKRKRDNGEAIKCSKKRENDDKSYKCSTCGKCFGTPQALGGHTTSAHPSKIMTKSDKVLNGEGASVDPRHHRGELSKVVGAPHVCRTCNMEFPSGQALGGHKRLHYNKPPVADSVANAAHVVATVVADEAVVKCFDLNQPPADDS